MSYAPNSPQCGLDFRSREVMDLRVMKFFILSASILAVFVGLSSCEKHDWEDTKTLYESHGDDHADKGGEKKHDTHAEESY